MTREKWFQGILKKYKRIAICGGPKSGKSTLSALAMETGHAIMHSDDLIDLGWSAASAELARIANSVEGGLVIEGVAVPRSLRKGMRTDCVVWLDEPLEPLSPGQETMRKGCVTVLAEWYATHKHVPMLQAPSASKKY